MRSGPQFHFDEYQLWLDARDLAVECAAIGRQLEQRGCRSMAAWARRFGARPAALLAESFECSGSIAHRRCIAAAWAATRVLSDAFAGSFQIEPVEDLEWAAELAVRIEAGLSRVLRGRA
ncbi:hypothetical protein [Haloferula sargassicola]|uniref:Four helix bundle protein n=1 Tax=Haloferula sargassicola TaxID=490096 RepID=A0ABP9UUW1_9BACT